MKERLIGLSLAIAILCCSIFSINIYAYNTSDIQGEINKTISLQEEQLDSEEEGLNKDVKLYSNVEFAGGDGSEENPFQISTAEQLDAVRNNLSASYVLINDIDLVNVRCWNPIGNSQESYFAGNFNGQNHCIKNMTINDEVSSQYIGLFGSSNGYIENLNLNNIRMAFNDVEIYMVGGIVGRITSSSMGLSNCVCTGQITADISTWVSIGGICGESNRGANIKNCINNCVINIKSTNSIHLGGIVGDGGSYYDGCINNATLIAESTKSGVSTSGIVSGIVSYGSVTNCKNYGYVSAISHGTNSNVIAGGISCESRENVIKCTNYGNVHAQAVYTAVAGGIVGYNYSYYDENHVEECKNWGDITVKSENDKGRAGGIVGYGDGTMENCHNSGSISVNAYTQALTGGIIGSTNGKNITINNCNNDGNICSESTCPFGYMGYGNNSIYAFSGGIVGSNSEDSMIENSSNTGCITSISNESSSKYGNAKACVGGITGHGGTIINSKNIGDVFVQSHGYYNYTYAGGINGLNGSVYDCENTGNINITADAQSYGGGIIGYISKNTETEMYGNINKGDLFINGNRGYLGGILGYINSDFAVTSYCYYKNNISAFGGKNSYSTTEGLEKAIPLNYNNAVNKMRYNGNVFKIMGCPDEWLTTEIWPIANASVTFGGVTKMTDENGIVSFDKNEVDIGSNAFQDIKVTANGYTKYSQNILLVATGENTITLKQKDHEKIYIESLILEDNNGKTHDLLNENKYTIDKTDISKQTINISMDWNGHGEGTVYLRGTNSGKMLEFVDGKLEVSLSQEFEADENIIVIAYNADKSKKSIKEHLVNIVALPPEFTLEVPIQSTGDMGFIPFMEGKEFKIGLDKGIEKYAVKSEVKDGKLVLEFSDLKDTVSPKLSQFKFFNDVKLSIGPYGKLEIPISKNSDGEWSGTFGIQTKAKKKKVDIGPNDYLVEIYTYNYNTVVVLGTVPLPVTASVEFKGGAKGELKISGPLQNAQFSGKFEPSVGVDLFGGLGVDYDTVEAKAGIYGDMTGKLPVSCDFMTDVWDFDPTLEGSIGARASVKVYIVELEGQFEAGKFKWSRKEGFEASWGNKAKLFSLDEGWHLAGREYLNNGGGFVGDSSQIKLFSLDVSNKDERPIYDNIFENSEAVIQNIDGRNYLIYTIDDDTREQQNGLKLVYSTENVDGTWTTPVAISDDGTLDSTVSTSGKFVIWEDMKSNVTTDMSSMADILSQTEISVAQFNGTDWESKRLTDNSKFDFSPVIVSNGNKAMAAWLSNSEADFSSQNGTTDIHYAIYDGSSWSDIKDIDNVGVVTRITLDYDGTNGNIFYKKDGSLYNISTAENTELDLGYKEVGQYTVGNYNGQTILAYFDNDNKLQIVSDVNVSKQQSSIEADVNINSIPVINSNGTDMYICWIDHQDGFDTLSGVRYENGKWSDKITFVGGEANISKPSLLVNDDGTFTSSYFKTGKVEVQEDGNYTTGTTNLYVNHIVPSYNISLNHDTMTYNEEAYSRGGIVALTFDVDNIGEREIDGLNVEIYEGDELKQTIDKDNIIKAGETQNISVVYTPSEKNIIQDITIKVVPKNVDDFDERDNSATITIGTIDTTVSSAYFTQEGGHYYINATLSNAGSVPAEKATIEIHEGDFDGDIIYTTDINDILVNEELYIKEPIEISDDTTSYFVTIVSDGDIDEYNNFSIAVLNNIQSELDYDVLEDYYDTESGQLKLSIKTVNNLDDNKTVTLIMAAYDENNGVLEKVLVNDNQTLTRGENIINTSFDCKELSDDFNFKLFVWDSIDSMQPLGNAFEKIISIVE